MKAALAKAIILQLNVEEDDLLPIARISHFAG